jgi:hypothetical protein
MGVSGQRHAPAALLPPGKGSPVPIGQEAGWAPEPVWTQRLEESVKRNISTAMNILIVAFSVVTLSHNFSLCSVRSGVVNLVLESNRGQTCIRN